MSLIFEEKVRDYVGPKTTETEFEYLDKSARPEAARIRAFINETAAHYPEKSFLSIRGKFRGDDIQFHCAEHEILLFDRFRSMKLDVEIEPVLANNTEIDFRVTDNSGRQCYVEALSLEPSANTSKIDGIQGRLKAKLEELVDFKGFVLHVNVSGILDGTESNVQLARQLSAWIERLSTVSGPKIGKSNTFRLGASPIRITVACELAAVETNRRLIWHSNRSDSAEKLERKIWSCLRKKQDKYGGLNAPYIISVNVRDWAVRPFHVQAALYGPTDDEVRQRSWFLWRKTGDFYPRPDAVWGLDNLGLWNQARSEYLFCRPDLVEFPFEPFRHMSPGRAILSTDVQAV